jgi:hypothetical protein
VQLHDIQLSIFLLHTVYGSTILNTMHPYFKGFMFQRFVYTVPLKRNATYFWGFLFDIGHRYLSESIGKAEARRQSEVTVRAGNANNVGI